MSYIELAIMPIPPGAKEEYLNLAAMMDPYFKKHGATRVIEAWGENIPEGKLTSFPMAVKCTEDETVCISLVFWPSKAAHTEGMPKVMEEMQNMDPTAHPFDGKRMIFAGFDVLAEF